MKRPLVYYAMRGILAERGPLTLRQVSGFIVISIPKVMEECVENDSPFTMSPVGRDVRQWIVSLNDIPDYTNRLIAAWERMFPNHAPIAKYKAELAD